MDELNTIENETDIAKNELRTSLRTLRDAWRKKGQLGQDAINILREINDELMKEVIDEEWPKV